MDVKFLSTLGESSEQFVRRNLVLFTAPVQDAAAAAADVKN